MTAQALWQEIAERLRMRDDDPAYANAPVLDPYARISRNPITGQMEKTDSQLFDILTEIERRHARLGVVLRDDNFSAWRKNSKRPGWRELLGRLEQRLNNGVICWHVDRLMRQPKDLERLIDAGDQGFIVGSIYGDYDLGRSDDRFTLRVLTAAAAKEGDNISRRTKARNERLRQAGHYPRGGPRVFGFPGKDATAEQVKSEREAIAEATRAHVDGTGFRKIARDWNERGLRTANGGEFVVEQVRAILARPRNAGLIAIKTSKTSGSYELMIDANGDYVRARNIEPIVTLADYLEFRSLLASRGRGRRPSEDNYFLSGGALRCHACGRAMVANVGTRRVYRCPPQYPCPQKVAISMRVIEPWVRDLAIKTMTDPRHVEMVTRRSAALAKLEDTLEASQETARELSRRLSDGMPFDRYDAAIRPIDERIARLTAERDALIEAGAANAEATPRAAAELIEMWETFDTDERRRLVRRAFPRGLAVYPGPRHRGANVADRIEPISA